MTLTLHKTSRLPYWPAWAVGIVLGWLAMVAAAQWLAWTLGQPMELCLFRRLTGLPCPTCGLTRGVLALFGGHASVAFAYNPLALCVAILASAALLARATLGLGLRVELSGGQRKAAGALAAGLLLANWVYLIVCVG
jgi:hypothetical protein